MSLQRQSLCYRILHEGLSVTDAAHLAGVSRKTLHKFLARYRLDPADTLEDRSRRPLHLSGRVPDALEARVLELRDAHGWGARKLHAVLRHHRDFENGGLCSPRTLTAILRRHGRITRDASGPCEESLLQRFERPSPNALWQLDHKGPIEIARRKHHLLTVLDDHSRFCLCFEPMKSNALCFTWPVLWECFGVYGLPEAILCDGFFADRGLGISAFDIRLVRLGIRPMHGRAGHPQTQGKVERLHGSVTHELLDFDARTDSMMNFIMDRDRWLSTYNLVRPHEALNDRPPISRYQSGSRPRPSEIPPMQYESDAFLRKVSQVGDIRFRQTRIAVGRTLAGEQVRLMEGERELTIHYGPQLLRVIALDRLSVKRRNQIV